MMIPVIAAKSAATPKASGAYRRVITGAARIPRAWAKVVPPTSLRTSDTKEEGERGGLSCAFMESPITELGNSSVV